MEKRRLLFFSFLIFGFVFGNNVSFAVQQTHWDGGGDGQHWSDPLNWDSDSVPTGWDVYISAITSSNRDIYFDLNSQYNWFRNWFFDGNGQLTFNYGGDPLPTDYFVNLSTLTFSGPGKRYFYQNGCKLYLSSDLDMFSPSDGYAEDVYIYFRDGAVFSAIGVNMRAEGDSQIHVVDSEFSSNTLYIGNYSSGSAAFDIYGDSEVLVGNNTAISPYGKVIQYEGSFSTYVLDIEGMYLMYGGTLDITSNGYIEVKSGGYAGGFLMDTYAGLTPTVNVPFLWVASDDPSDVAVFSYKAGIISGLANLGIGANPYLDDFVYGSFYFDAPERLQVDALSVGGYGSGILSINNDSAILEVESAFAVGNNPESKGVVYHNKGKVEAEQLLIGYVDQSNPSSIGCGEYYLSDDAELVVNNGMGISGGVSPAPNPYSLGPSFFQQDGGDVEVNGYLSILGVTNDAAFYRINDGYLTVNGDLLIGSSLYDKRGSFQQYGGSVSINDTVKIYSGGEYELNGGSLSGDWGSIYEFYVVDGKYSQSGGEAWIGDLYVNGGSSRTSEVEVLGGNLYLDSLLLDADGSDSSAAYHQDGGYVYVSDSFLEDNKSAVEVEDGYLQVDALFSEIKGGSVFTQKGGRVSFFELSVEDNSSLNILGGDFDAYSIDIWNSKGVLKHTTGFSTAFLMSYGIWDGNGEISYSSGVVARNSGDMFVGGMNDIGKIILSGGNNTKFLNDDGSIYFTLAGYEQGLSYDFLEVFGSVEFRNTNIYVSLWNMFDPEINSVFDIIWAQNGFLPFDLSNFNIYLPDLGQDKYFDWKIEDNNLRLFVKPRDLNPNVVPEPAGVVMFIMGIAGMAMRRKK